MKSYITELDDAEEARLATKTYALEQNPQQAQIAKEIKAELDALIEKHQIRVNVDKQLDFMQLMKIKCQKPKFFYEFKK